MTRPGENYSYRQFVLDCYTIAVFGGDWLSEGFYSSLVYEDEKIHIKVVRNPTRFDFLEDRHCIEFEEKTTRDSLKTVLTNPESFDMVSPVAREHVLRLAVKLDEIRYEEHGAEHV